MMIGRTENMDGDLVKLKKAADNVRRATEERQRLRAEEAELMATVARPDYLTATTVALVELAACLSSAGNFTGQLILNGKNGEAVGQMKAAEAKSAGLADERVVTVDELLLMKKKGKGIAFK